MEITNGKVTVDIEDLKILVETVLDTDTIISGKNDSLGVSEETTCNMCGVTVQGTYGAEDFQHDKKCAFLVAMKIYNEGNRW